MSRRHARGGGRYTPPRRWAATQTGSTLYVLPAIADDDEAARKNALALRNAASTSGRCPACGATFQLDEPDGSGVLHAWMGHEDDCPVLTTSRP